MIELDTKFYSYSNIFEFEFPESLRKNDTKIMKNQNQNIYILTSAEKLY